jgi:hypothetical protein
MSKHNKSHEQKGKTEWWVYCADVGAFHGKEGTMQVLAGLAQSSQTVGSLFRVIREQEKCNSWMTDVNTVPYNKKS